MKNIALKLGYLGTNYHGWQRQDNAVTVQETLENALAKILKRETRVTGCGRTDAGVHASLYCANFKTEASMPVERLPLAVNALLPCDIAVSAACQVEDDFNAIISCEKKEYTYKILNAPFRDPFLTDRAWFYPQELDVDKMTQAAAGFIGTHDFRAVQTTGTKLKSTVRTVYYIEILSENDIIEIKVCANGFLYNMMRAITGTLVYVSIGKIDACDIPELLKAGKRSLSGPTAPACGLYMTKLWYGGNAGAMLGSIR